MSLARSRFVRSALASASVIAAMTVAPLAGANNDVFLEVDGVQGESNDQQFSNAIVVNTFSFGVSTASNGDASGASRTLAGGKAWDSLTITKKVDKASPKLFLNAATGEMIKTITLSNRRTGPKDKQVYYKIKLSDVLVSSVKVSEGTDVMEMVSFTFGRIEIEYKQQNPDGSLGSPIKVGYDVKAGKKV